MYFTEGKTSQLNDLLNRIGIKLQLNKTRKEKIERSYNALCEFISNDTIYFGKSEDLKFYAQGSYSIQTTVKPKGSDEFDLDFILEVDGDWQSESPLKLLGELKRLFSSSETYKNKLEIKTRCIRINYEDGYHIDILPAFPFIHSSKSDTRLKVPDREIHDWTDSNPKGYASWFEERCSIVTKSINLSEEKKAEIEPLPETPPYEYIKPLRRVVQLMKRYRDIYYENKKYNGVKSIILTTLAAKFYSGENNVYDAITSILTSLLCEISKSDKTPIEIYNPTNTKEKLSEKWDEDYNDYLEFCRFIESFHKNWESLLELESFHEKVAVLQELFGESIAKDALLEQTEYIEKYRKSNKLAIDTRNGNLTSIISTAPKKTIDNHTFYGE